MVTSAKGIVRLNRSQMSIILTYDVFGRALDTLMNLFGKRNLLSRSKVKSLTYIVVNTSMTVKLTVMMASKKKGLKYTVMWPIVFSRTVGT